MGLKPRARMLSLDHFWEVIDRGKDSADRCAALRREFEVLSERELAAFDERFWWLVRKAWRWELWHAAHIIQRGCSDDGFNDFCRGLISLGRGVYEAAVDDADSLAETLPTEFDKFQYVGDEAFGCVALDAYEARTGKEFFEHPYSPWPETAGQHWPWDDDVENARRLPRIWRRFGARYRASG